MLYRLMIISMLYPVLHSGVICNRLPKLFITPSIIILFGDCMWLCMMYCWDIFNETFFVSRCFESSWILGFIPWILGFIPCYYIC